MWRRRFCKSDQNLNRICTYTCAIFIASAAKRTVDWYFFFIEAAGGAAAERVGRMASPIVVNDSKYMLLFTKACRLESNQSRLWLAHHVCIPEWHPRLHCPAVSRYSIKSLVASAIMVILVVSNPKPRKAHCPGSDNVCSSSNVNTKLRLNCTRLTISRRWCRIS